MFEELISAIVDALAKRGIPAAAQYRRELLSESRLVCVGMRSGRLLSPGAGEYLGMRDGQEIYGFRAEVCAAADIFAMDADECLETLDSLGGALGSLPAGLRGIEMKCGQVQPDDDTGMYCLPVEITGTAYFSARTDEDSGQFLDFSLRGVLK